MAALIKKGGPNRAALRKALDPRSPFRVCYSSQMFDEHEEVLARYPISSRGLTSEAEALLRLIAEVGDQIVPKFIPAIVYPDGRPPLPRGTVYAEAILLRNNRAITHLGITAIAPEEFLSWCEESGA